MTRESIIRKNWTSSLVGRGLYKRDYLDGLLFSEIKALYVAS